MKYNTGSECHYGEKYILVSLDDIISWHDADLYCMAAYETHLASTHSETDHSDFESIFIWNDNSINNIEFWGDWEPTSNFNGDTESFEDCVYLAPFENNRWNDLDCSGDLNDIQMKAFLCNNPNYNSKKGCNCKCDICEIYGDPHFEKFDDLKHHYQGQCAYYYVKYYIFFFILSTSFRTYSSINSIYILYTSFR